MIQQKPMVFSVGAIRRQIKGANARGNLQGASENMARVQRGLKAHNKSQILKEGGKTLRVKPGVKDMKPQQEEMKRSKSTRMNSAENTSSSNDCSSNNSEEVNTSYEFETMIVDPQTKN